MRDYIEPINRLIRRDPVGSCDLPVGMPTTDPEAYARLAERAGWWDTNKNHQDHSNKRY